MTAPYTSPVSGLIQTIFALRDIKFKEDAQKLAQEQFGLQQEATHTQIGATHESQVSMLSNLLKNTQDPKQLLAHVDELSTNTGFSTDFLKTLINQTKPSVETTKEGIVSEGAAGAGPELKQAATSQALAGMAPGKVQEDALLGHFIPAARAVYDTLPKAQRADFDRGILQKVATGQSLREASLDVAFEHLSPEEKKQAARIGAELAPGATADAQIRLGWANLRLQDRKVTSDSANDLLRIQAMMAEAKDKLKGKTLDDVLETLKAMTQHEQFLSNNSATQTPEGRVRNNATLNAFMEQLRQLAPAIYGPQGTIPLQPMPLDKNMTATGLFNYLQQSTRKP